MRPLLVLILVLAALAALVFGVLSFLREPPAQHSGPAAAANPSAETTPARKATSLEKAPEGTPERALAPGKVDEANRAHVTESSAGWVYENELAGTVMSPQNQPLAGAQVSLSTAYELMFAGDPIDTSQD